MTKIDIFSGFLGAGKTTLIKKLIKEAYCGEKLVLIENEFGQIGIDGGFLQDAGIEITEMNSGCICCSLVGDFGKALKKVLSEFHPDRILIEPSGVGKLSDVIRAVQGVETPDAKLNSFVTVVDAAKCKLYLKNFGEFFLDQVSNAGTILLSHTKGLSTEKVAACVELLRAHNTTATIITTDWDALTGAQILSAMEREDTLEAELAHLAAETHSHHDEEEEHHHHHHDEEECDDPDCECHHHHEDDEEHHHHHHDEEECDDPDCECHHHHEDDEEHHHHHHGEEECDDPDCECHHHHHADEVFTSWGKETPKAFTKEEITACLNALEDEHTYGFVLRAKGIVPGKDGQWIHYDYVPGEPDVRNGSAAVIGRICVIGSKLNKAALATLFGVSE